MFVFFFFKQKTAYEMRISDWSSDVCSSDLDSRRNYPGERRCAAAHSSAHSWLRLRGGRNDRGCGGNLGRHSLPIRPSDIAHLAEDRPLRRAVGRGQEWAPHDPDRLVEYRIDVPRHVEPAGPLTIGLGGEERQ